MSVIPSGLAVQTVQGNLEMLTDSARYVFVVILTGGMIYLSTWAPRGWTITDFTAIVPMSVVLGSHALTPLVLNPSLMIFNY